MVTVICGDVRFFRTGRFISARDIREVLFFFRLQAVILQYRQIP
jgi:hypothetical protein